MKVFIIIFSLFAFTLTANAFSTQCADHYFDGKAPEVLSQKKMAKTREICYSAYGLMHSGVTKTPLWSAEHLLKGNLVDAKGMRRVNNFHPDSNLSPNDRAELKDYARSGWDRGHMTPSGDMPNEQAQRECFTLANMIPQDHENNTGIWEGIESAVRSYVIKKGEAYVITGPLYIGNSIEQLNGRLFIPTHIFKILYDPKKKKGAAYIVENKSTSEYSVISIDELEKGAEINFFPGLDTKAKQKMLDLPEPVPHSSRGGNRKYSDGYSVGDVFRKLLR